MELSDILSALRDHVGDDKAKAKEVAEALLATAQPVGQALVDKGAGRKAGELDTRVKAADTARDAALRERDEVRGEFDEFKQKVPDAAAIEKKITDRFKPQLDEAVKARDAAIATLRDREVALVRKEYLAELARPGEDGTRVNPAYLKVAELEWGDRFRPTEDGRVAVLQLDSDLAYEAPDPIAAAKLLAKATRKLVPDEFIQSGAIGGGGRGTAGGYGPPARTADTDTVLATKRQSGDYSL